LEKTLENLLDCNEIQPCHPEGDESWVFIGRTDVEGETPILWPPDEFSKFAGILSAALSQHHLSGFGIAQLQFHQLY